MENVRPFSAPPSAEYKENGEDGGEGDKAEQDVAVSFVEGVELGEKLFVGDRLHEILLVSRSEFQSGDEGCEESHDQICAATRQHLVHR